MDIITTIHAGLKPVCVRECEQINNQSTKKGEKDLMQSYIVEHYLNKAVEVYCGGPDVFRGIVETCNDNVLTLTNEGKLTHVAIDKIIALWPQ